VCKLILIENSTHQISSVLTESLYLKAHLLHYLYVPFCYALIKEGYYGSILCWDHYSFLHPYLVAGKACGKGHIRKNAANGDEEVTMETLYLISGIIAVGLLIYLVIALMKPEIFS
jgi:K+-transporting ATPase KdpF subunit